MLCISPNSIPNFVIRTKIQRNLHHTIGPQTHSNAPKGVKECQSQNGQNHFWIRHLTHYNINIIYYYSVHFDNLKNENDTMTLLTLKTKNINKIYL